VEAKWKFIPQLGFLSILLMVHRCYPALEKYIKTNKVSFSFRTFILFNAHVSVLQLHSGNAMEFYHGYKKNSFGIGTVFLKDVVVMMMKFTQNYPWRHRVHSGRCTVRSER